MSSAAPPPSRYRSVRNAASAPEVAPDQDLDSAADNGINRSRSRYHRKPGTTQSPPLPQPSPELSHVGPSEPAPVPGARVLSPQAEAERRKRLNDNSASRQAQSSSTSRGRDRNASASDDQTSPRKVDSTHRHDSPMLDGSLPAQKKTGSNAPQQILSTTVNVKQEKSAGCFGGLFKRKKNDMVQQQPDKAMDKPTSAEQFIKVGGGGIVPGTDAPKSAVNSGQRRVLIECNRSPMQFPVDPDTTAADLLQSAANVFSEPIDPKTYVLLEYFCKVGIQRPLRRYERVRDVMNSWDDDRQNSLMIMPAPESGSDPALLHVSTVSATKPEERYYQLFYSQRVGKWDRRHIFIRSDGQVAQKKHLKEKEATNVCHLSDFDIYIPTVRQSSKKVKPPKKICFAIKSQQKTSMFESTTNFVHFFCTDDKDDAINFYRAIQRWRSWYLVNMMGEGVRQPKPAATTGTSRGPGGNAPNMTRGLSNLSTESSRYQIGSFQPLVDTDKIAYRSSLSQEKEVISPAGPASASDRRFPQPSSQPQELDGQPLINKATRKRASVENESSLSPSGSGAFAANGLLGRTYSQRQREQAAKELAGNSAFTSGPSLLNGDNTLRHQVSDTGISRNTSTRDSGLRAGASTDVRRTESHRRGNSTDLARASSTRMPQKPLVDLTPSYKEPPQHQRKGRGHNPSAGGALIENATTPDNPLRGRGGTRELHSGGAAVTDGRARSTSRTRAQLPTQQGRFSNTQAYSALTGGPDQPAPLPPSSSAAPRRGNSVRSGAAGGSDGAFVAGGLVDQAGAGWGAGDKGRGVGGHGGGGKPLVDLGDESRFAAGSLLAQRERAEGRGSGD